MQENRELPEQGRLSIVAAMVMLAYASAAFVHIPENAWSFQLPGFYFVAKVNFYTILSVVVTGMAAAGTDWVIASHPQLGKGPRWHHWIIPALTALVIGVPLNQIAVSAAWWVIFCMGGVLFAIVLISEYISVDLKSALYPLSIISLSVVSLALFLILSITVRGAGLRLYAVLSAIVPSVAIVSARILNLRLMGKWPFHWIAGISIIVGQLSLCLFYLPIEPIPFGLILLGATYALTSLAVNLEEISLNPKFWIEPSLNFAVFLLLAILL
jgi:hypothetical protein